MADGLAIQPRIEGTGQVRRASSGCCGAKLNVAGEPGETQHWTCRECGQPCDRVMSAPEEVTLHG